MKKNYILPIVGTVLLVLYGIIVSYINASGYKFVGGYQKLAPIIIVVGFYVFPLLYIFHKNDRNIKSTVEDKIQVPKSYKVLEEQILKLDDEQVSESDDTQVITNYGDGYIAILRGISWLQLIVGCFVGLIILIQPSQSSSEENAVAYAITDPIKHLSGYMGFYLIISSIFVFVFLTVISNIAENTVAIRINSEKLVQNEIER